VYISTSSIATRDVIESIMRLSEITGNIELSGGAEYDENLPEMLIQVKREKSVQLLLHGYFPPPQTHFVLNFSDVSERTRNFIRESISLVRLLSVPYYSIHGGFTRSYVARDNLLFDTGEREFSLKDMMENVNWFRTEFPDIKLAVENMYPNNGILDCAFLMHVDEIIWFMDTCPDVQLLLDLGHLKISASLLGFDFLAAASRIMELLGDRLVEIHLSENNGINDDHYIVPRSSEQVGVLERNRLLIHEYEINITIESRNETIDSLLNCYEAIRGI